MDYNYFGAGNFVQFKVAQRHTDTVRLREYMEQELCERTIC